MFPNLLKVNVLIMVTSFPIITGKSSMFYNRQATQLRLIDIFITKGSRMIQDIVYMYQTFSCYLH
uniref:Uncharacterized protein n=1 Tax=Rhizophora mucronata TaxID=61149 RepID=A0A2P2NGE3_RHIMU